MRTSIAIAVTLLGIAVIIAATVGRTGREHEPAVKPAAPASNLPRQAGGADGRIAATPQPPYTVNRVQSSQLINEDHRFVALSPDEVVWMQKHHYPSAADLASLGSLRTEDLAGTRDARLATLHGLALLARGEKVGGIAVLTRAATLGSIYAYEEAAVAEYELTKERLGDSAHLKNALRSRLEVARIMGDDRVDYLASRYLSSDDSQRAAASVQPQTTEFLRQIGSDASLLGIPAPGPDPRPNQRAWQDIRSLGTAGESEAVDVYRY